MVPREGASEAAGFAVAQRPLGPTPGTARAPRRVPCGPRTWTCSWDAGVSSVAATPALITTRSGPFYL